MTAKAPMRVPQILKELRSLLDVTAKKGVKLQVADDGFVEEGDWLNIIVTPVDPNMRSYDYIKELNDLEAKLRHRVGRDTLLLVPAVPA